MTGSSGVVLSNLAYLIGAVVLAIIGGFAVWLHHRQPRSIDANVDAFQRGLQAIAPDSSRSASRRSPPPTSSEPSRVRPRSAVTLQADRPAASPAGQPGVAGHETAPVEAAGGGPDPVRAEATEPQPAAGDGGGDRAGAGAG